MTIRNLRLAIAVVAVAGITFTACAHRKVESAKLRYEAARIAQESGKDLQAALHWKLLLEETSREIDKGQSGPANYFMRASAHFELGNWEAGFEDLKQISPGSLSKEEFWIQPLYLVLMGDHYSRKGLHSVAGNFYQSVLKKSSLKASPVFLLALERHVNNSIRAIDEKATENSDPDKFRLKEYSDLSKDVEKYVEDYPFSSVSHFLLGDLLMKTSQPEESMEHLLAALEMGLPTQDLRRSAEFQVASLLTQNEIPQRLKSALLSKAIDWWGNTNSNSILTAGENTIQWVSQQTGASTPDSDVQSKVRYLAVQSEGKLKILAWEKL